MAYIDREKFIDVLYAKADMALGTPKEVFLSVAKMLELIPAADVVPQTRGEWRFIKNMMCECSVCNDCFNYYSSTDLPNFCSSCGAKMKGGAEGYERDFV